ncbi:hypothetical protein MAUB_58210 [Mycolicibacterium aubagnense]|uniref:Uncharacterized protein n=3 Tax=Mycolicibacterium aubagnense TaxID=319707 RepID=A0ABM7IMB3_9MYCO|nr:hypothetical protein MAUB_58210 [Mycolicibacterium aubagnense]
MLVAGVTVIDRDRSGGVGLSALPGATGQPAPTGPTGGGGSGGSGGAPPFPLQPPEMPSGPPNGYNSGSYPAPDQGNGISIYNSGAPQSPGGSQGYQQAPSYPQQQLQPANGVQPPDYDAPLQTAQPQEAPHASAAPTQSAPQTESAPQPQQQSQSDQSSDDQSQQHCSSTAAGLPGITGGGGRGLIVTRGLGKLPMSPLMGPGCVECPPQAGPEPKPQAPPSKVTAPCQGDFDNVASILTLQQSPSSGIPWGIKLQPVVSDQGVVNMSVEIFVDGKLANVYEPHLQPWNYVFHGPLPRSFSVRYEADKYTMHAGSEVSFLYHWYSVTKTGSGGYGFVNCLYTAA